MSTPAGLDIGARTAHEIALSILAEIIDQRPQARRGAADVAAAPETTVGHTAALGRALPMAEPTTAIDPVCGMSVEMVESSIRLDHAGTTIWFCAPGCRRAFAADPAAFGA